MLLEKSGAWLVCGVERSYLEYDMTDLMDPDRKVYGGRFPWFIAWRWLSAPARIDRKMSLVQVLDASTGYRSPAMSLRYVIREVLPKIMPSSS